MRIYFCVQKNRQYVIVSYNGLFRFKWWIRQNFRSTSNDFKRFLDGIERNDLFLPDVRELCEYFCVQLSGNTLEMGRGMRHATRKKRTKIFFNKTYYGATYLHKIVHVILAHRQLRSCVSHFAHFMRTETNYARERNGRYGGMGEGVRI